MGAVVSSISNAWEVNVFKTSCPFLYTKCVFLFAIYIVNCNNVSIIQKYRVRRFEVGRKNRKCNT